MTSFDDLYTRWRGVPFPLGSHQDDLDELHADLVLVDTWVADTVVPYVERGVITPPQVDIGAGIRGIRDRAAALREGASGADQATLKGYLDYIDLIDKLYTAFRREHADRLI
jgi:hypothetical protein